MEIPLTPDDQRVTVMIEVSLGGGQFTPTPATFSINLYREEGHWVVPPESESPRLAGYYPTEPDHPQRRTRWRGQVRYKVRYES